MKIRVVPILPSQNPIIVSLLMLLLIFTIGCEQKGGPAKKVQDPNYLQSMEQYREDLLQTRKQNYLPLVALLKMNEDELRFGKDSLSELKLEIDRIPDVIGTFSLQDSIYIFSAAEDVVVENLQAKPIKELKLTLDEFGNSQRLFYNDVSFQIISRNDSPYLRVWDEQNPAIEDFMGFRSYPINPQMVFEADFTYYVSAKSEQVKSQLGPMANTKFIGKVSFPYKGKDYSLDVGNSGFIMVADATTGSETYGGGRYMYIDLPEDNSKVKLDFNELYNPPCSFNQFTTCLYPPRQNRLPIRIEAGETITRE